MTTGGAGRWLEEARRLIDEIERTQMEGIAEAANRCATTIAANGMVHMFGTGHSRIPLEEMFPRYGSYPGFHPIAELSMTFHTQITGANGQRQAMFIERVHGLAEQILANFHFGPDDLMMIFSASGLAAVPVEMAIGAHHRGMDVIAVTSVAQSMAGRPGHESGTRLLDHADVLIDLRTPVGDGLVLFDGLDTPVGPGSTFANVAIVNEIKVQTAALLLAQGALPPVITAAALVGEDRANSLFERAYEEHSRRLGRLFTGLETP